MQPKWPQWLTKGLLQVAEEDKAPLLEAMERSPHLVRLESHPHKFLLREDSKEKAAVKRLCHYWSWRKQVFGEQRAFLPMSLLEGCAMDPQDVAAFKKGSEIPLPDLDDGRGVLFHHTAQKMEFPPMVRKRLAFYVLQILSEHEKAATEGVVLLVLLNRFRFSENGKQMASFLENGTALRFRTHLFCELPETLSVESLLVKCAVFGTQYFSMGLCRNSTAHSESTLLGRKERAMKLGFHPEHLPPSFGGSWDEGALSDWIKRRKAFESTRYARFMCPQVSHHALKIPDPAPIQGGGSLNGSTPNDPVPQPALGGEKVAAVGCTSRSDTKPLDTTEHEYARYKMGSCFKRETPSMLPVHRKAFDDALRLIPDDEKTAYLEVLTAAPSLVEAESDPLSFLRVCNFLPMSAARRFVAYWNMRKEVFGDKAFRPMNLKPQGAVSRDDFMCLGSAVTALLPRDSAGRTVVFEDRSRTLGIVRDEGTDDSQLRSLFYLLTLLSGEERNQTEGIIWVVSVVIRRVARLDHRLCLKKASLLDVFPLKIKCAHLAVCPPRSRKNVSTKEIYEIISFVLSAYRRFTRDRVIVQWYKSEAAILHRLKQFGLSEDSLPSAIHGKWMYEAFTRWTRKLAQDSGPLYGDENGSSLTAEEHEEERKSRKRKLNIIHSRLKRERRKAEELQLQQERDRLIEANKGLRAENMRYEQMLFSAQAAVSLQHRVNNGVPGLWRNAEYESRKKHCSFPPA